MEPNFELEICDADLERMEAEAKKKGSRQAGEEIVLGDEELDLPDFPC